MVVDRTKIEVETKLATPLSVGHECHKTLVLSPYGIKDPKNGNMMQAQDVQEKLKIV